MDIQELFQKATDLRNNGKIEEAVKAYQQVIGEALKHDREELAAESSHMIGVCFYQDKDYDNAIDYLLDAREQIKRLGDKNLLGAVLRDLGMAEQGRGDLERAKDYLNNSIYYLKEAGNLGHAGMTLVKLGKLYEESNQTEKAQQLILEGIENISKSPERFFESTAYLDLAQFQLRQGEKDQAKISAEKSLEILNKMSNREQFQPRKREIEKLLTSLSAD